MQRRILVRAFALLILAWSIGSGLAANPAAAQGADAPNFSSIAINTDGSCGGESFFSVEFDVVNLGDGAYLSVVLMPSANGQAIPIGLDAYQLDGPVADGTYTFDMAALHALEWDGFIMRFELYGPVDGQVQLIRASDTFIPFNCAVVTPEPTDEPDMPDDGTVTPGGDGDDDGGEWEDPRQTPESGDDPTPSDDPQDDPSDEPESDPSDEPETTPSVPTKLPSTGAHPQESDQSLTLIALLVVVALVPVSVTLEYLWRRTRRS